MSLPVDCLMAIDSNADCLNHLTNTIYKLTVMVTMKNKIIAKLSPSSSYAGLRWQQFELLFTQLYVNCTEAGCHV